MRKPSSFKSMRRSHQNGSREGINFVKHKSVQGNIPKSIKVWSAFSSRTEYFKPSQFRV